jgi:hypothetical protein
MQIDTSSEDWSIYSTISKEKKINPKPQYQRTPVWKEGKKQLLIDSILRGYDLPKFYLRLSDDSNFEHEVVDGQQRLHAIWDFCNDKYALGDESEDIPEFGDLSGKKWSELSGPELDRIGESKLTVAVIKNASEEEIRQLFLRLQEGVSLNPAEKRNAISGNMRDFIEDLGDNQRVFPLTTLSEERFGWHDLAALVTCLEMAHGPTDVKAPSLRKMYNDNQDFNVNGSTAKKVKQNLAYMARVLRALQDLTTEMNIKWGFVDLYLLITEMDRSYVIRNRENDFAHFFDAFENERQSVIDDHSVLLSQDKFSWGKDLYDYIEAFNRSAGTRRNVKKRHEVYTRRFIRQTQDVIPKDPQRTFNHAERMVIWRKAGGICQVCDREIKFNEMEADHIQPHSQGGKTTVDNGQALCKSCNARKGVT